MNRSPRIRLVGLVTATVLAVAACSSGSSTAIDGPTYSATTTTSQATSTTLDTTTSAPTEPDHVELEPVTIDPIGVASVAPAGWIEELPGVFTSTSDAQLMFGAFRTWLAPNPAQIGFEQVERLQVGGRWWDILAAETPGAAVIVAVTGDELMQYSVELVSPPAATDHYIDAVAMPAIEAFEVIDPDRPAGVLEAAEVAVDGRSVAYATGGAGDATVIFESGWSDGMAAWAAVGDEAAEHGRVFAYDRPGIGHSDPTSEPRDGAQIVAELRTVLDTTGHEPPYVLVGHSLGGLYMELFARIYPEEVTGLVLVDASTVGQDQRCIEALGVDECDPLTDEALAELPEPGRSEGIGIAVTMDQVAAAPGLDTAVPAVVLVADQTDVSQAYNELWIDMQRERAAELGAEYIQAEGSSHFLQNDRPDLVLQAIEDMIEQHRGTAAQ